VSRARRSAQALRRRARTQQAAAFAAAWPPALQRSARGALRCVRGTRAEFVAHSCLNIVIASGAKQSRNASAKRLCIASLRAMTEQVAPASLCGRHLNCRHAFTSSRLISPELCLSPHPQLKEGAGKTGEDREPVGSHRPPCQEQIAYASCTAEKQGNRRHPGLPCSGLTAYVSCSPGSDALLLPSPCGWLMHVPGRAATSPQHLAHRPRAPGPHDFAVREPHPSLARGLRSRLPALQNPSRRCNPRPPPPGPRS